VAHGQQKFLVQRLRIAFHHFACDPGKQPDTGYDSREAEKDTEFVLTQPSE
jgi:hypothetical protein